MSLLTYVEAADFSHAFCYFLKNGKILAIQTHLLHMPTIRHKIISYNFGCCTRLEMFTFAKQENCLVEIRFPGQINLPHLPMNCLQVNNSKQVVGD